MQDLAEIVKPDPVGSIPSLSAHPRRLVEPSDSIVSSCVLQCPHPGEGRKESREPGLASALLWLCPFHWGAGEEN